ncbi:MAG TPA: TonB-dependent receptor [Steroidobacteraceae bacterium]|nr:TonB-dependent receptor [Steroidobacteraceae bacterium]
MRGLRQAVGPICLALALHLAGASSLQAAESLKGRPIAEVLRDAARPGLRIVYSDELVPADLLVGSEPTSSETVGRLDEILRPHGLALMELSPGTYVVTRQRAQARPPPIADGPIEEVRVISSRFTLEGARAANPMVLSAADIAQQPALFEDAVRSVRRFPGTAGSGLSSRSFVRGGAADENLLLLDGVALHDPFHLPGLPADLSAVDPAVLGRVDFYAGVLPVEYGERASSVLDMRSRSSSDTFAGRIALGTMNASALFEGPLPRGSGDWLAFARRSTIDWVAQAVDPDIGKPVLSDALARLRFAINDRTTLTLGGLGADDDLSLHVSDREQVMKGESDRGYAWAALDQQWGAATARTLLAQTSSSLDRSGDLADPVGSLGHVEDQRQLEVTELKQDWNMALDDRGALHWGVSLRHDRATYEYQRTTSFPVEISTLFGRAPAEQQAAATSASLRQYGAYVGTGQILSSRWRIDGGLRWTFADYSTDQKETAWDPRVGFMYHYSPVTRLRASWGRMTQIWGADELPIARNQLAFDPSTRSTMTVLAWEHDFARGASVRAELYQKETRDPRPRLENLLDPISLVPELLPDLVLVEPDSSRATGLDVHVTTALGEHSNAWLSYSWSHARDVIDGREVARSWDQRHSLAVGAATESNAWQFSGLLTIRSDWPVTPVFETTAPPGVTLGERNSEREGFFMTLDLKAERSFRLPLGSLRLVAELTNALNRDNFCCTELEYETLADGTIVAHPQRESWLPAVPYVSVAWEF